MRTTVSVTVFLLFILLCGCAAPPPGGCRTPETGREEQPLNFDGQVTFVPLEGGFYAITSDAGEKFDPVNLPESFRRDGLRVQVKARLLPRFVGMHMWGAKIEIIAIERL